jgi:hypothetical protein
VILDLKKYIELKRTPIVVVDQVEYLPEKDWLQLQTEFKTWLDEWRKSWGSKDLDKYMSLYSERFKANGMNKNQWRSYKKSLNQKYKFIDVDIKDVQIFDQGPKLVVRFQQNYKSDQKADVGVKTIYALKSDDKYKIVGENWEPMRISPPEVESAQTNADGR